MDHELINVLEDVREWFKTPVSISGPNRCAAHNADQGGASKSQHVNAKAADIKVYGAEPYAVYKYLDYKYPNKYGIGLYYNRVHIDVRPERARWDKT